jgi:Tol biopolymer transport system component
MAQPFEPEHLKSTGVMFPLADQIGDAAAIGFSAFSASQNGVLVYQTGDVLTSLELIWRDRQGNRSGSVTQPSDINSLKLSPDEKHVAYGLGSRVSRPTAGGIWLQDVTRDAPTRLTLGPNQTMDPVWSPDSASVAFTSMSGSGRYELHQEPASGAGKEELLLQGGPNSFASDWSRDGKLIVYSQTGEKTGEDLWLLPLDGDRKPVPYLQTRSNEIQGQFSPDHHWMAYASDEFGQYQVYVQPIPANGAPRQISTAGGTQPRWRSDGKELFYVAADRRLMAVPVKIGVNFERGPAQALFEGVDPPPGPRTFSYQPAGDGKHFLVIAAAGGEAAAALPITVVLNWEAGLKK